MQAGDTFTYYPRSGKPGHEVEIVSIRPHPFHGAVILIKYLKGKNKGKERVLYKTHFYITDT